MKKNLVKLIVLLLFVAASVFLLVNDRTVRTVQANSSGPPARHTGAPGELTCTDCHGGSPNTEPGQFSISGLPPRYEPGTSYQITVQHTTNDSSRRRRGFELNALDSTGNSAGRLANNSSSTQIVDQGSRQYIEHTASGTYAGQANGATWTLNWTAPSGDVGPVTFYAAGNQANNNGSDSGDQIYTTTLTINAPLASGGIPVITGATVSGKKLIVTGANFDNGATLLMDGSKVKKTANDESNPTTTLISKKGGTLISSGQTVELKVRNPSGLVSESFSFTRP